MCINAISYEIILKKRFVNIKIEKIFFFTFFFEFFCESRSCLVISACILLFLLHRQNKCHLRKQVISVSKGLTEVKTEWGIAVMPEGFGKNIREVQRIGAGNEFSHRVRCWKNQETGEEGRHHPALVQRAVYNAVRLS